MGGGGDAGGGFAAGDAAGGKPQNCSITVALASCMAEFEDMEQMCQGSQAEKELFLEQVLQKVEILTERASRADEERRRCLEATRSLKGSIRIMGRGVWALIWKQVGLS